MKQSEAARQQQSGACGHGHGKSEVLLYLWSSNMLMSDRETVVLIVSSKRASQQPKKTNLLSPLFFGKIGDSTFVVFATVVVPRGLRELAEI